MTTSSVSPDMTPEQQIFAIADRCRIPLRRLRGETMREVANRLTLEIEQRITLMLLELEELATIDVDDEEERWS